ncbi:MAG: hypothetical protein ABH864_04895 [archaeon]
MSVDVKNLIAAISPDVYCDPSVRNDVKKLVKKEGYIVAAGKAKLVESVYADVYHLMLTKGALSKAGLKAPVEQHTLVYDAFAQSLEPVYFWILDFAESLYGGGVDKLTDNFVSSAGSGFFAEMQGRATRMQEEAMKMMQTAGVLTKSVIQIIYDLKEFKLRLRQYEDYRKPKNPGMKNAALLSLKQIWMDNVDIKRGNGSINGLAQSLDFVTIRDAFMVVNSLESLKKLDLNDRVKRILEQRVSEFFRWIDESERELNKRYNIEKTYLRSQVNSLKIYSRWAKPYFKAARQLEQNATSDASVVNAFNTSVFELVLLVKGKYDPAKDVANGELPKVAASGKFRKQVPIGLIEFKFRSIPDRTDQKGGYSFRGKVNVKFTGLALNEDELKTLKKKVEEDDFGEVFKMVEGATTESLGALMEDINEFLDDASEIRWEEKKSQTKASDDVNPFSALFDFAKKEEGGKDYAEGQIPKDNFWEAILRSQAILDARLKCRKLYDTYKKAHGMLAFPPTVKL